MIIKSFDLQNKNLNLKKFVLFYGKNEGHKNEEILKLIDKKKNISNYDEKEILENPDNFINNLLSGSLFDNEKIIIIKRTTDKIIKIVEELVDLNLNDINFILNSDTLEKRSKLRSLFEKDKKLICVPFYPDTDQTLLKLTYNFLKEKKISISPLNINLIVSKCNGDRINLLNELQKIENLNKNGKEIDTETITKLVNLAENHSISELIDNCLAKNKRKIIRILNENNFSSEDCILIIRTFLNKAKKILKLSTEFENNKNMSLTISSAKPPIFWKDKEITKQQIYKWPPKNIKNLIYKLSNIEVQIKKNISNAINLISDFILEQSSSNTNN